jgi:hypothetical protein
MTRLTVKLNGSTAICTPHDAHIYVSQSGDVSPIPCFAQSISQISLDEARALQQQAKGR